MPQIKPPITYEEQIEKLKTRGCIIEDTSFCTKVLSQINYYRLSAYFLPFKKPNGDYISGTSFNKIFQIYEFDRELRNLLFSAIEEIEIYLKAKIAYFHAHKYGATGYLNKDNYNIKHRHDIFHNLINTEIKNNNKVLFVKHHINKYGGQFPIWAVTELFTFGMLSYFYSDLPKQDQKQLARDMFATIPKNLSSWLRCCTDLRNICAHYGRLYFRIFSAIPANIQGLETSTERRLFGAIMALRALYPDKIKWNNNIYSGLYKIFLSYLSVIDLNHIGFPANWESKLIK